MSRLEDSGLVQDDAEDGAFSPLQLRCLESGGMGSLDQKSPRKPRLRVRAKPKRPEYYTVYHATGKDTSCILNPYDIVPTVDENQENTPYLVILDTHVLKWHHIKLFHMSMQLEDVHRRIPFLGFFVLSRAMGMVGEGEVGMWIVVVMIVIVWMIVVMTAAAKTKSMEV